MQENKSGKSNQSKVELVNLILEDDVDKKIEEEDILHLLLQHKVSKDVDAQQNKNQTFGARMADNIAKFAGSWTFILIFIGCLIFWIILNSLLIAAHPFDTYPFILLNLVLSCIAAIQAPVIMMSQNRQEVKDRLRAQNDYKTNLKAEIIIEDLHHKLDEVLINQEKTLQRIAKLEKIEKEGTRSDAQK